MKKKLLLSLLILLVNCYADVREIPLKDCKKISGMPGPEDMIVDRDTKILYVSSHERRIENQDGKIYKIDLNSKDYKPVLVETNYPKNFRPHGLSLAKIKGKTYLYIISHPKLEELKHSVEVFEIQKEKVLHVETIKNEFFTSPNDLFVTETGEIFLSNDHGSGGTFRNFIDDVFRIGRSKIAYFNGNEWKEIGDGVILGNGIHYKKEGNKEFLYRAATVSEKIYKYEILRTGKDISLRENKVFNLETGPDNFDEDDEGNLYFASHKSIFRFLSHVRNKENISPSQVFKLDSNGNITEIYANRGKEISASSTGLKYNNILYISQVFEDFILNCPTN